MERSLLFRALVLEATIRIGLWILPSRVVLRHVAARVARLESAAPAESAMDARGIARIVRITTRRIYRSTCLTRALTTQLLLARRGCPSVLRIGVSRSGETDFHAHAWVEVHGRVVIGNEELHRFVILPDLGPILR